MSTPFLDQVYAQVDFDRELVFKFFVAFGLFEYALKEAGYLKPIRNNQIFKWAQADWTSFARKIDVLFSAQENEITNEAKKFILANPPQRQENHDQSILWRNQTKPDGMSSTEWLSILIRSIRNNLFHGAKVRYRSERDTPLIQSAMTILENWAHLDPNVERVLRNVR